MTARAPANRCRFLLVVDNGPLQAAAWSELVRARGRLEKATRDVHRYEETDQPAFQAWLAREFPTVLSELRELSREVVMKSGLVSGIQSESFFSGRSVATIWREWHENGDRPPEPPPPPPGHGNRESHNAGPPDLEEMLEEEMKQMFGADGVDDEADEEFREFARAWGFEAPRSRPVESATMRDLYRRLVLHLHPDRGGEWTTARARLWEQVQNAWAARDADWLARLEAEWEASADLLGPKSAVGRLRAALTEIDAARRDAERKVRVYRKEPAWRFSLLNSTDRLRERIRVEMEDELQRLQGELEDLKAVLADWQQRAGRRKSRNRRSQEQFDPF